MTDNLRRTLRETYRTLRRASAARYALEPGTSRARVTTANARWRSASEEWNRMLDQHGELALEIMREARDEDGD